ncbi:MAG: phosphoribosylanthranilate isomerase [Alphaproteobacteria bacterium]|nr:phosphoribosylanthranilate isomerase [Alphaproteobacteria bacterium]
MSPLIKICGLTSPAAIGAAVRAGATHLGFVFFPGSPRELTPDDAAALIGAVPEGIITVALVRAQDIDLTAEICAKMNPGALQVYGLEAAGAVPPYRARFDRPLILPVPVRDAASLDAAVALEDVADYLLFDAKSEGHGMPGGTGAAFNWELLKGRRFACPWFLAGGLAPENVARAIARSGTRGVDVSSGVEEGPGHKSERKIADFVAAARRAFAQME